MFPQVVWWKTVVYKALETSVQVNVWTWLVHIRNKHSLLSILYTAQIILVSHLSFFVTLSAAWILWTSYRSANHNVAHLSQSVRQTDLYLQVPNNLQFAFLIMHNEHRSKHKKKTTQCNVLEINSHKSVTLSEFWEVTLPCLIFAGVGPTHCKTGRHYVLTFKVQKPR